MTFEKFHSHFASLLITALAEDSAIRRANYVANASSSNIGSSYDYERGRVAGCAAASLTAPHTHRPVTDQHPAFQNLSPMSYIVLSNCETPSVSAIGEREAHMFLISYSVPADGMLAAQE